MNKVVHFEMPVDDMNRAKKFYTSVFGWDISDWPIEGGGSYTGVRTVEVDENFMPKESGAINGGMVQRDEAVSAPILTISVDSIDACIQTLEKEGGSTLTEKREIPNMGSYAYVKDSEGNVIGLWQDKQ